MMIRWFVSKEIYVKMNRMVMSVLFFMPLLFIAFFESTIEHTRSDRLRAYFAGPILEDNEGDPDIENPKGDEGEISKIKFDELIEVFPK
jgi:hypothetical protein